MTAEEVERYARALLTAPTSRERYQLRSTLSRASRQLGSEEYRRILERIVSTSELDAAGKAEYLGLANWLGASDLFRDTMLELLRDAEPDVVARLPHALGGYVRSSTKPRSRDREALLAAAWGRVERGDIRHVSFFLGVLAEHDAARADRYIIDALADKERSRISLSDLYSALVASKTLPTGRVVRILETELRSPRGNRLGSQLRGSLERIMCFAGPDDAPARRGGRTMPLSDVEASPEIRALPPERLLEEEAVASFLDMPPIAVVRFLDSKLGLGMALSEEHKRWLSKGRCAMVSTRRRTAKQVLALALRPAGLVARSADDRVEVVVGRVPDTTTREQRDRMRGAIDGLTSFSCRDEPLVKVLALFRSQGDMPIVASPDAGPKASTKVTLSMDRVTMLQCLEEALRQAGLEWRFLDGAVYVY